MQKIKFIAIAPITVIIIVLLAIALSSGMDDLEDSQNIT
jgi:hypothetical protein